MESPSLKTLSDEQLLNLQELALRSVCLFDDEIAAPEALTLIESELVMRQSINQADTLANAA